MDTKFEISSLLKTFISTIQKTNDEIKNVLGEGLEDYLDTTLTKYYLTYTFLHRERVKFEDIYYPLSISNGHKTTKILNPEKFISKNNYVSIIGTAGCGKSMLLKYIYLRCIRTRYGIPIFLELRKLNDSGFSFEEFISDVILSRELKPSDNILKRSLKKGKFVFILDGYDELYTERKSKFSHELETFIDVYSKNAYIISSRPSSGVESLPWFIPFKLNNLKENELNDFVDKIVFDEERKSRLLKVISLEENRQYLNYFSNPLLFSMFILAFENHPEIPKKKSVFYQNVFDTLYSKHDGINKNSFVRQRKCGLQKSDYEEIISLFSATSFSKGEFYFTYEKLFKYFSAIRSKRKKFSFDEEDLILDLDLSISILTKEGLDYTFPHRSMQEYFTGVFAEKYLKEENDKERFLLKILEKSRSMANDRHRNFWALLSEIDNKSFVKYYLIKLLKEITLDLDPNRSKLKQNQLINMVRKLEFGCYYITQNISSQDGIRTKKALKFRYMDNVYWDALNMVLPGFKNELHSKMNTKIFKSEFTKNALWGAKPLEEKKMYSATQWLYKHYDIFTTHGLMRIYLKLLKEIHKKIDELIREEKENQDEIMMILGED